MFRKLKFWAIFLWMAWLGGANVLQAQITSWDQLYNAFQNGGAVTLTQSITYSGSKGALVVPSGKTVTLDLNGYTINRNLSVATKKGSVIQVKGKLIINDGRGGGQIRGGFVNREKDKYDGGGGLFIYENGEVIMNGGSICYNKADKKGPGVVISPKAKMTMNGGSISYNQNMENNSGGGVYIQAKRGDVTGTSEFTMYDGEISHNIAGHGAGVYVDGETTSDVAVFNFHGGRICYNVGNNDGNGGGVCVRTYGYLNMDGGYVFNNHAAGVGGGIFLERNTHVIMTILETPKMGIYGNTAGEEGDDITSYGGNLTLISPTQMTQADGSMYFGGDSKWITDNSGARFRDGRGTVANPQSGNITSDVSLAISIPCPWCTLQDMINDAANGSTITLDFDCAANLSQHFHFGDHKDCDICLFVPEGKNITIDLNGHTIDRNLADQEAMENGEVFHVAQGASLTITDSSINTETPYGKGLVTGGNNDSDGGGIHNVGVFYLNGGNISLNKTNGLGGGVFNKEGNATFEMNGGAILENVAAYAGGGVCNKNTFTMTGGLIDQNEAAGNEYGGGGLYNDDNSTFVMAGGTISNNIGDLGGAIQNFGIATIYGGNIEGNTARLNGNGIFQNGTMNFSGNPVFGTNDVVYLFSDKVITKTGDIDNAVLVPVKVQNEFNGRDILVSSTEHNVVKSDLSRMNVMIENTNVPRLSKVFTSADAVTSMPVIELFACLWSEYVITCPATGYSVTDGNATISSKEGLAWLISVVNGLNGQTANNFNGKTVTLTNNVDMTEHIWEAIGTATHPFLGTFTSNGSTIKGLNNNADYGVAGLFGVVNGTVSNAFVEGCNFVANPDAETYFGIIANTVNGGTVHSSEAMGTLEAANANAHIGGVVGLASGSSEVHSVISYATLNGDDKGGIVNKLDGAGLKNSYAKFSQFTSGKELVATNNSGTVDNCYYVNGTTQKMSDATDFTIPGTWPYGYGVSGCMIDANRMIDVMNVWVNTNGATKYAAWAQPTTNGINADCPVLKLKDFNTMASNAAPYIYYGDLDNKLGYANILFYGQKVGSSAYSGTNLYIDQDAALKTTGTLKANVGVPSGKTYGWHMFSTSLSDAPLGINYTGYVNVGNDYGTPQTQVSFTADNGYFPTNSPYANWDFYCFDESNSTWVNYKRNTGDHFDTYTHGHIPFENETTLVSGRGYLMALKDMTYVQAYGTLNNANVNATVTYSGHHVKGCNFIGNPYHAYLDFDAFCTANSGKLASNSYAMIVSNGTTSDYITYAASSSKNPDQASRYIHPHQGFIVKVNAAGTLSFTPDQAVIDQTSPYREEHLDYPLVNLFATDSEGNREIATAELGRPDNGGALKIDDMLTGKGSLAISNEGQRYAIAFIEGQPNEVAVHFIANEDGDFTMSWNTHNGTFSYLHLVDNMTGMDVDCLASEEYKFTAHAGDYASRFKLKFEFTGVDEDNAAESAEEFAFFHQGSLVVNGQGSLELIDLNGRTLMSKRLENVQSMVTLPEVSEGLYLLRLADDSNVKTQKIIIKK